MGWQHQHVLAVLAVLTRAKVKGLTLQMFVFDVWVMDALFYIYLCFDWFCRFDLEWFSRARKFWNVRLLMTVWSSWGDLVWSLSHEGKWTVNYWLGPLPPSPLLPPSPNTHTHHQPVRWRAVLTPLPQHTLIPSLLDGGLLHPFGVIPDGERHGDCRWRRSWPLWIWRLSCCGESECGCFLSLATGVRHLNC